MSRKTILIIAPPRVTLQDVTGPWEVFCRAEAQRPGTYDVAVVSASAQKKVDTKFGLGIVCEHSVCDFAGDIDTVLVAGSEEGVSGEADPAFLDWLRDAAPRTRRMGSICTGRSISHTQVFSPGATRQAIGAIWIGSRIHFPMFRSSAILFSCATATSTRPPASRRKSIWR